MLELPNKSREALGAHMLGVAMEQYGRDATLAEFQRQVVLLTEQRIVDFKAMVSPSGDAPTRDLMWAFANALRLDREEGMIDDESI